MISSIAILYHTIVYSVSSNTVNLYNFVTVQTLSYICFQYGYSSIKTVTNFIQLVSSQLVDQFSQTKLC